MINVYSQDNGELIFSYTKEMEPEVMDCGHYFTIYYLSGFEEEDGTEFTVCDYESCNYYYEEVA